MVKVREDHPRNEDGAVNIVEWLETITKDKTIEEKDLISKACLYAKQIGHGLFTKYQEPCYHQGLIMAEILTDLKLDAKTIAASIVYSSFKYGKIKKEELLKEIDPSCAKLILTLYEVDIASEIAPIDQLKEGAFLPQTLDNMRKMLLTLSVDIRTILIKLAQHLCDLRFAKNLDEPTRQKLALEAQNIFAPVANRLGIGQLKWEMEDLAFRYLEPNIYKNIATLLNDKRIAREKYIQTVVTELENALKEHNITAEVHGRVKHIYSIWRKMQRKMVDYSEIYDVRAIRIIVKEVVDCYAVLGTVHALWQHIPKEFDDYIARPKPNGYQSLHTAVVGPEGKILEIQIRTLTMHQVSELGVAAHWKYKEGIIATKDYEQKLVPLRKAINWQDELILDKDQDQQLTLDDRPIYVFTPTGDVIELPNGATPIDFAYMIHTDVGNKCRGAKVNGKMVPLTAKLLSGSMIEILTTKVGGPSRDWLNQNLKFVKTARARAKIQHWFKQQDKDINIVAGKDIIHKELKRLGITNVNFHDICAKLPGYHTEDDIFAAIAVGDLKLARVLGLIQKVNVTNKVVHFKTHKKPEKITFKPQQDLANLVLNIGGIGNMAHHVARCCKPKPGDDIVGYVTISGSVSVHKADCINILQGQLRKQERFIEVFWYDKSKDYYTANVIVKAYSRPDLLNEITHILSAQGVNLVSLKSQEQTGDHLTLFTLTLEFSMVSKLGVVFTKIQQVNNVVDVYRIQD